MLGCLKKLIQSRWSARSTVFAGFFATTAFYLALKGLLTGQYVAAITAIHAFIVARSIAEDHNGDQSKSDEQHSDSGDSAGSQSADDHAS